MSTDNLCWHAAHVREHLSRSVHGLQPGRPFQRSCTACLGSVSQSSFSSSRRGGLGDRDAGGFGPLLAALPVCSPPLCPGSEPAYEVLQLMYVLKALAANSAGACSPSMRSMSLQPALQAQCSPHNLILRAQLAHSQQRLPISV